MEEERKPIDINSYILEHFTPCKLPEAGIKFVPAPHERTTENPVESNVNAQLKCKHVKFPFARSDVIATNILEARALFNDEAPTCQKHIYEIVLDDKPFAGIELQPGDTIGILPHNEAEVVHKLLHALDMESLADDCFEMQAATQTKVSKLPTHIPHLTTPREVLRDCLNLQAVPKKQFLRALAACCSAAEEADFMNCLSSKEGVHYYNSLVLQRGLQLLDLLELCRTCRPTLGLLVEFLPRLMPRPYSLANSPLARPNEISIVFSLLLAKPGLTTNYMARLANNHVNNKESASLLVYVRDTSQFRYRECDAKDNQVLIGIGTAISPFEGFLEHKAALCKAQHVNLGETWLFVGATHRSKVWYRNRLQTWLEEKTLDKYFEAISREYESPAEKGKHVQDLMRQHSEQLVEFLQKPNTNLYVCADGGHISADIDKCLSECLQQELHASSIEVAELLKAWRKNGKYKEDIWL